MRSFFFSLFAPDRDDGFIRGVGPAFILPTATKEVLGQEKWQAGPAALGLQCNQACASQIFKQLSAAGHIPDVSIGKPHEYFDCARFQV